MIRQARTYLFGAVSATSLIVAAVVAFVALVSLQALRDWPLAGLAEGDSGTAAVSAGHPVKHGPTFGVGAGKAATPEKAPAEISRRGKIRQSSTDAISPSNGSPQAKSPTATPQTQSTAGGGSQPNPSGSSGGSASGQRRRLGRRDQAVRLGREQWGRRRIRLDRRRLLSLRNGDQHGRRNCARRRRSHRRRARRKRRYRSGRRRGRKSRRAGIDRRPDGRQNRRRRAGDGRRPA